VTGDGPLLFFVSQFSIASFCRGVLQCAPTFINYSLLITGKHKVCT